MATIKSVTSLEQSKKLAEILPLESADMWWVALNWQETEYYVEVKQDGINQPKKAIPCWSLVALLGILEHKCAISAVKQLAKQNPAWSEEDEKKRTLLISILEVNHPNEYFKVNPANTLNMEAMHVEELVDWLKFLKNRVQPQSQWKPSGMELEVLRLAAEKDGTCLMGLYEQLKKLRED